MITVKIVLDTRSVKKDKTSPLKLRLLYYRNSNQISLGYCVLPKDWDSKNQRIKSSCSTLGNINRVNALLLKRKQKVFDILSELDDDGRLEVLSFKEIKEIISSEKSSLMTLQYCDQIISGLKESRRYGNARAYETMKRSIKSFEDDRDFPLKKINYAWLKKYENWFLAKGNSVNGLAVYLRSLRALFNRATKENLIQKEYYPFDDYKIKSIETRKRAISQQDLDKLKKFIPTISLQERAKDYFLISFYMMGASFIDLAYLKVENIKSGRIAYRRRKTGRLYNIIISKQLQAILDKYLSGKDESDYILNVISSKDPEKQQSQVRDALRRYNKTLKTIGNICGIESNLTSYVARHSYATIAKYIGVPTSVISEALGHESEKTTQVYLDSFETEVLDSYHEKIINNK